MIIIILIHPFEAFGVSHHAMEKLEAAGETVLIQGIFLSNHFNRSLSICTSGTFF